MLLQIIPDIWTSIADNGLSFVFLAVAVVVLWRRDNIRDEKMDKYLSEDRAKMVDVIEKNTAAFTRLMDTLDELKEQRK